MLQIGHSAKVTFVNINMIWWATFWSGCSPAFHRIAVLKNIKGHKNMMESCFKIETFKNLKEAMDSLLNIKNFKSHKKVMESFFGIKTFKTVMVSFFIIKNVNSRKKIMESFFQHWNLKSSIAMMEFSLSFISFKNRNQVTESFFSGHALLSFHMMHKTSWNNIFCQFPLNFFQYTFLSLTIFLWLYNLISMKKDAEHNSVNPVRASFLLQK